MRLLVLIFCLCASPMFANIESQVRALFQQDLSKVDLAEMKIDIDRMVDPSINKAQQIAQIDHMAKVVATAYPKNASSQVKLEALTQYIYQSGPWNQNNPFRYDLDDPYGDDPKNKLLSDYLQDRQGNCITMPFLFIILGERLGLQVAPAMAPLHVYVRYTDDAGKTHNLETTSGAGRARDQHYKNNLPVTEVSIQKGVFLASLNRKETVAVMAAIVVEDLIHQRRYDEAIAVSDILLEYYPKFVYIMVKKATAAYYKLQNNFYSRFPTAQDVPQRLVPELVRLQTINQSEFKRAEDLGWKPVER